MCNRPAGVTNRALEKSWCTALNTNDACLIAEEPLILLTDVFLSFWFWFYLLEICIWPTITPRDVLTFMLLVVYLTNTKWCKKPEKGLKLQVTGTHLRELNESFPMNTNMTRFRRFSKIFASLFFGWKYSLSIGRVKVANDMGYILLTRFFL